MKVTECMREIIDRSPYNYSYVATELGMTRQALYRRLSVNEPSINSVSEILGQVNYSVVLLPTEKLDEVKFEYYLVEK